MKKTVTATLLCALATPSFAGGPVIIAEDPEVVAERPASSLNPIVPLLILLAIGIAVSGNDDPAPCTPNSGESC
ncbi:hypothetical protein [Tabrizicola sp.]|uniref:hypothetical protein n=1 Tax=Tabrizicola sp. TaxID=2005166 RepID=UPI0027376A51|nr:hypothetical protein [Tabrizicola sp.]MDP3195808.1 hypothetical protein [Tabrizicola sp.]MDZ4069405.1 hypothetical protein [Tabrizicola sp.]